MDTNFVEISDQNDNYEPSEQEIIEYIEWLGGNPTSDRDLFWIARDALKAPIPPGWKLYQRRDGSGEPFYFNEKTGESLWDHPLDKQFKEKFAAEKRKKSNPDALDTKAKPLPPGSSPTDSSPAQNPVADRMNEEMENHRRKMEGLRAENQIEQDTIEKLQAQLQTRRAALEKEIAGLKEKHERGVLDAEEIGRAHV
jgi:hypothetical protein